MPQLIYIIAFIYGTLIGSFLNVCIYRIPKHENIVITSSHCMHCNYKLKAWDLVPVFSWLFLRGRCRQCKERLSVQYPLIEAGNGVLWVITIFIYGINRTSMIFCLFISVLLVLSIIDMRTYEIPFGINVFIFVLGVINAIMDYRNLIGYIIGFFLVSGIFYIIYLLTKGAGIGGGDIKLMAAAGLLLGWKAILLAMILGCLYGSVIHILRMKLSKADHVLAMGPYLSMGLLTAVWFGNYILAWYEGMFI